MGLRKLHLPAGDFHHQTSQDMAAAACVRQTYRSDSHMKLATLATSDNMHLDLSANDNRQSVHTYTQPE